MFYAKESDIQKFENVLGGFTFSAQPTVEGIYRNHCALECWLEATSRDMFDDEQTYLDFKRRLEEMRYACSETLSNIIDGEKSGGIEKIFTVREFMTEETLSNLEVFMTKVYY